MPSHTLITSPNQDSYNDVQSYLSGRMEEVGVTLRVQNRVQVAADEIWTNIVRYSGATRVSVRLDRADGHLLLHFADNGVPYDPAAEADPDVTLPAEERQIGGLGLCLVRRMTTAMTYRYAEEENRLTLEFSTKE